MLYPLISMAVSTHAVARKPFRDHFKAQYSSQKRLKKTLRFIPPPPARPPAFQPLAPAD